MSYAIDITVEPTTPINEPLKVNLEITPLIIKKVGIVHPTGCVNLVGCRFFYRAYQIYPYNDRGWFLGNGQQIVFEPKTELIEPPHILQIQAYNLDDYFTHTIIINLDVEFIKTSAITQRQPNAFDNIPVNMFTVRRDQ